MPHLNYHSSLKSLTHDAHIALLLDGRGGIQFLINKKTHMIE